MTNDNICEHPREELHEAAGRSTYRDERLAPVCKSCPVPERNGPGPTEQSQPPAERTY